LYIFIFWSFFALKVKVGVPEFFMHNAESKWFSEHRPGTVPVYRNTHLQNYAVGFLQNLAFYFCCEKCLSNFILCPSVLTPIVNEAQNKIHFPKSGCTEL